MMDAEKQSSDSQAMSDLPKRLRIKASMIALGERIAWGSDTAIMEEAADMIESLIASIENHQLHMLGMARDRDQLRAMLAAIKGQELRADPVKAQLLEALEASNALLRIKRHACGNTEVCRVLDTHITRNSAAIAAARKEVES